MSAKSGAGDDDDDDNNNKEETTTFLENDGQTTKNQKTELFERETSIQFQVLLVLGSMVHTF